MGGSYQWPSLAEVLEYRRQVREVVIDVIENAPLEFPITPESPWVSLTYCNLILSTSHSGHCSWGWSMKGWLFIYLNETFEIFVH